TAGPGSRSRWCPTRVHRAGAAAPRAPVRSGDGLLAFVAQAGHVALVLLLAAAPLGAVGDAVQPRDLALALDPRRVSLGQPVNERVDPVAQMEREVRRGGVHQLAHVLD